jgi:hypothetical protein
MSIQQAGLIGFNLLNIHTVLYLTDGLKEPAEDERHQHTKSKHVPFLPNFKFCLVNINEYREISDFIVSIIFYTIANINVLHD